VLTVSEPRRLVTTGELAKRLGISRETVRRYYNSGDLTPAELSPAGHPRWVEDDVREQMRRLRERLKQEREDS
jgi:predicted site-specific integrase-resolvase